MLPRAAALCAGRGGKANGAGKGQRSGDRESSPGEGGGNKITPSSAAAPQPHSPPILLTERHRQAENNVNFSFFYIQNTGKFL